MKHFNPGDKVVLNEKAKPLAVYPAAWIKPGQLGVVEMVAYTNDRKRVRWYSVRLHGKSGNTIGSVRLPSNWLNERPA